VHEREDVVGLDAALIMHPRVWEASGHLAGFSDPLVDCRVCKERFRADKAPRADPGAPAPIALEDKGRAKLAEEAIRREFGVALARDGRNLAGAVAGDRGYVCPVCGSPFLSAERRFNLMFRTTLGPVDPLGEVARELEGRPWAAGEIRERLEAALKPSTVYLRPETAQAMFVQFQNVQQSMSLKLPFGIAQMGKSFRNEITTEHFIFRSCEFEQMELEWFCEPGTQRAWLDYWCRERLAWWRRYARDPEAFRLRPHEANELAHYADACYDAEYRYPWGWDELEGIASRTDYDLRKHSEYSGERLTWFDQARNAHITPYVVEPAAGATRGVLVFLLDAYREEQVPDAKGEEATRVVLGLHPRLAPIKAAVLPLVKKDRMPEVAREVVGRFLDAGVAARCDEQHAIGRRYRRHDEAGTPWCLTVDGQTLEDRTVTIRDRDTMAQERISIDDALAVVRERLNASVRAGRGGNRE
ncbi:MAG: glycine--tRNA ligase, partial [Planctomycetes bacterium]|nr:glycine--tRNA ligase [Planctomycetota bacterium]